MFDSLFRGFKPSAAGFSQASDQPIRLELLGVERLEQTAEALARTHHIAPNPITGRLLGPRLRENARELTAAYRTIADSAKADEPVTAAAEWLLDNFHIVEEQVREILDDMPAGFYRRLPKLTDGAFASYPRVFAIAWAIVGHTDSGFDLDRLLRFMTAYQRAEPLTIGELWAFAISLRLVLVENLRRLADMIVRRHADYQRADRVADLIVGAGAAPREPLEAILRGLGDEVLSKPFAVQLSQQLRDQDQSVIPAFRWLEERLAAQGLNADAITLEEQQVQAGLNVSVRNVITSMRLVSAIDWPEFVESVSLVDVTLRAGGDFAAMDFPTRDLYRRAIEELALGSGRPELEVARRVVERAAHPEAGSIPDPAERRRDPGYYLLLQGRRDFEKEIGFRIPVRKWLARAHAALGISGYLGMVGLATLSLLALAVGAAAAMEHGIQPWMLALLALLGVIPASDLALALINQAAIDRFGPAILPGLELSEGVPRALRTIVVMPALLFSIDEIDELIKRLEVHYLSSADGEFYFALLTDWTDSDTESAPTDRALLDAAAAGIANLNHRYHPGEDPPRFFLLHRRRVWNASQRKWIGWERKRGKLHELNRLLRGAADTSFIPAGDQPVRVPDGVRYVITLDADTRLPRGAARRLVGKMAHRLNLPLIDPKISRVVEGHGILQPRVTPSLPIGRGGSLFQRAFSGANGLDPYAFAVSDIYQDLFGEGSYVGKGIYDVDAFEAALHGRIPESTVLSHDLLEGIFVRAALASDIELVEEFPSRYDVAAARQHRWQRGDWQLLPWIVGRGREKGGSRGRSAIPPLGRWKMLDNLRRSLSAPSALSALLAGWTLAPPASWAWTGFVFGTIALPLLLPTFLGLIPQRTGISKRGHLRGIGRDLGLGLTQSAFMIVFLAHQSLMATDAILRTFVRIGVSRRHLLEWTTAAQAVYLRSDWRAVTRQLCGSITFGLATIAGLAVIRAESLPVAIPFIAIWMASPALARWASRDAAPDGRLAISPTEKQELRLVARRTWRFFETFITAEHHMLPPDNFQEDPQPVVANRTSPTNIGLYLLATVAARDFGWLSVVDMVERLEATFATMTALERFRGHFFNWYDTKDLRPLDPRYISSVDSGNLAGHLIALGGACRETMHAPLMAEWATGVRDALDLARESSQGLAGQPGMQSPALTGLDDALTAVSAALERMPSDPVGVWRGLNLLVTECAEAVEFAETVARQASESGGAVELRGRVDALRDCVTMHLRQVETLAPWAALLANDPELLGLVEHAAPRGPGLLCSATRLSELPGRCGALIDALGTSGGPVGADPAALIRALGQSADAARSLGARLGAIAGQADAMFAAMDFRFLFDSGRHLFSIGYQVADGRLDGNYYDLLASEARLTSFVAIAKDDVPAKHWFRLGRTLTPVGTGSALISWSGSMFEYLMPSLVVRAPAGSLIELTNQISVRRQITYGAELGTPWGISESLYNARDVEFTYQYSGFGVPDLGYKRGLGENIVIAPYATALAAMIEPAAAARNFRRLTEEGGRGAYGWYDALDYTPERLPEGAKVAVVRAYMAHHQAMSIIAIANALEDGRMRARFHSEPVVQSTELLLQERMPRGVPVARPPARQPSGAVAKHQFHQEMARRLDSPYSRIPRTHLLSNGRYSVMLTSAGSGYSRWGDFDITRWREDVTCDNWGSYIFFRDTRTGELWSAGYQPTSVKSASYQAAFSEDRAEITREDGAITSTTVIAVSPEDDAEVRRITLTNRGSRPREIEITSYAEIALARHGDDLAHQAFSKLFIETEFLPAFGAIIAHRRPRAQGDEPIWAAHLTVVEGEAIGDVQFDTDRGRFLGRGNGVRQPAAVMDGWPLSNSVGAVLDPIFSLRRRIRLPRGGAASVSFWTLVAPTREALLGLIDKHHDAMAFERATTFAWTQAQIQLRHLGIGPGEAHLFQRIANRIIYSDPALRAPPEMLARSLRKASTLWAKGISGDLPIVLARIDDPANLDVIRQLLRGYEYWRMKRLPVDLVILNEKPVSYIQDLQEAIEAMVRTSRSSHPALNVRGNIHVLRADLVDGEVTGLLQGAARVIIHARRGSLAEQIRRIPDVRIEPPAAAAIRRAPAAARDESRPPRPVLEFFNGFGGFAEDGREYVTIIDKGQCTPAPWINVIANPAFGFHVSAEGSGFTWAANSQQNQVTAWSNDPVRDPSSEAIYILDEDSGELWTPTALPIREKSPYIARHGFGYTRFEHRAHDIAADLLQYVPLADEIKISRLTLTNLSGTPRQLCVTAYVEWVLGTSREASAPFIVTERDPETGAIHVRNPWNNDYGDRVAFVDLAGKQTSWTGDRGEFLGRNRGMDSPAGLVPRAPLSNTLGAGFDPCTALQTRIVLGAGETRQIVLFLGQTATADAARGLVRKYRRADLDAVFDEVRGMWRRTLEAVQVKTPDRALDIMLNGWLAYQTLACRVWARAAFYQASGAYGFRDQLQDVLALCASRPEIAREHILRAAGRQFVEGDVQHWWLPESGRGIRTRISDDVVWLSYAVGRYMAATGDDAILDEVVPFLDGPPLKDNETDGFFQPTTSTETATLFEHCARGLDRSLATGAHGLPLMGTGDWNDGMNAVGAGGKGESVWLGWFLHAALTDFAQIALDRADAKRAAAWLRCAAALKDSLEESWDGDWYRRAYFDDGTPMGSVENVECRIDSIAQSWAVISKAAEPARARRAMEAVEKYLVRRDDDLILLFQPPFDTSKPSPGYIQGYPKGVRENGGQYTHAATWTVLAFAMLGDGDKAAQLFAMLNPINHSGGEAAIHRYRVEPYVICGDIYSMPPQVGRGGWTWYSGSAGWMYRVALDGMLGFRPRGAHLEIDPCIPRGWRGFNMTYRYRTASYDIAIENPDGVSRGVARMELNGQTVTDPRGLLPLVDDGKTHKVRVVMGQAVRFLELESSHESQREPAGG